MASPQRDSTPLPSAATYLAHSVVDNGLAAKRQHATAQCLKRIWLGKPVANNGPADVPLNTTLDLFPFLLPLPLKPARTQRLRCTSRNLIFCPFPWGPYSLRLAHIYAKSLLRLLTISSTRPIPFPSLSVRISVCRVQALPLGVSFCLHFALLYWLLEASRGLSSRCRARRRVGETHTAVHKVAANLWCSGCSGP
jgi:hypothetical protein